MSGRALRLVILGRQGSGKGTQCLRLVEHYGTLHVSTGDMLRAAVADIKNFPFAGTTVLIAVGVALETMKQIDSQLMMRNYESFLK